MWTQRHMREHSYVILEADIGVVPLQAKEMPRIIGKHQKLKDTRKDFPLQALEEA